jgi:hypothetical protein
MNTVFLLIDLMIVALVAYVVHLLRCIRANTAKRDNKDLFQK